MCPWANFLVQNLASIRYRDNQHGTQSIKQQWGREKDAQLLTKDIYSFKLIDYIENNTNSTLLKLKKEWIFEKTYLDKKRREKYDIEEVISSQIKSS